MFTREKRGGESVQAEPVKGKAAPLPKAGPSAPALPRHRYVCPCGGGCPRCTAKAAAAGNEHILEAEAGIAGAEVARAFMPNVDRLGSDRFPTDESTEGGAGRPIAPALRNFMERQLGHNFSGARIHTGKEAIYKANALDAAAFAEGEHIYFGTGAYDLKSPAGVGLIAHELTHVAQQRYAPHPFVQRKPRGGQQTRITSPQDDDPIHDWVHPSSAVLLMQSGDKLFIVPAERLVLVPRGNPQQHAQEAPTHFATDLGNLFAVPASGASATRVFKAGTRTALILDAGSDPGVGARVNPTLPTPATGQAAIYTTQLSALMADLGITKVSQLRVIHGHLDHVGGVPAVVEAWGTLAQNVVIPKEYENLTSVRQAVRALHTTTDTNLTARGFGSAWNPTYRLKDKGSPGSDVFRNSFLTGELVVEMVGLRSALKGVQTRASLADTASLMTKVTRRTDGARAVVLGDLRGQDLEQIKNAMEAESPGSWNSFFAGAPILSGFSHHVGRLDAADLPGIMSLLDATLLQSGSLNIVEQTNPTTRAGGEARVETLELLSRLGANVTYTSMPVAGAPPSSVTATKSTVTAAGPQATVNPVIQSNLTTGLERLRKLLEMQDTIEKWRPWLDEISGAPAVQSLLNEIQTSSETLRASLRTASESAVKVRAASRPAASTGPRDYSSTGGTEAQAFQTALNAIPEKTQIEKEITPAFTRSLEELRQMPVEEIPLRIAVHQAITKGIYSDQAFTYLLQQLTPASRDSLIYGKKGGPVPRNVAFERVRMQVEFERSVLPGETWSVSHWESAPARGAAIGVNVLMLALELWNDIGQPLLEAHRTSAAIQEATQVVPFLRRIMFWQTMGAQCLYTGVHDPTFGSPSYITDPQEINKKINDLDGLYMQSPGLTDADILRVAAWLSYNVRNFDEFSEIFTDSKQDAVTWETPTGEGWVKAKWKIKTGYYETSGSNHVEEKWEDNQKLTQFMQKFVDMIISNTEILIDQFGTGKDTPAEISRRIGDLSVKGTPLYRARLQVKSDTTDVEIPVINTSGTYARNLKATLKWWSEPEFYVLDETSDQAWVTGADYNTYALIRRQQTEKHFLGADESGTHDYRMPMGNEAATVIIKKDLLERVPEAGSANTSAQPNATATVTSSSPPPPPNTPLALPQIVTGKDVAPRKGTVEIGPQIFQKPGGDPGKGEDTLPGAKFHF